MVGDTTFEMEVGVAAGVHPIGVSWGYHDAEALRRVPSVRVIDQFSDLPTALEECWRRA